MNTPPHPRLILDLYHAAGDEATLRAAGEFARLLGLDLHGLFIEDDALLSLAGFPFAREIRLPTHEWHPIEIGRIEAELRQTADQARQLLNDVMQNVGVVSEFEVKRGDPATLLGTICRIGDILVQAQPAGHRGTSSRLPVTSQASAVLHLPGGRPPRTGPIVVLSDHQIDQALAIAGRVAMATGEDLIVLRPAAVDQELATVPMLAAAACLQPERVIIRPVYDKTTDAVLQALMGLHERLIVMSRNSSGSDAAARIVAARGVPVLRVLDGVVTAEGTDLRNDQQDT